VIGGYVEWILKRRQGKEDYKENWIERTSCDLRIRRTGLK
jgi:hypothetical protein